MEKEIEGTLIRCAWAKICYAFMQATGMVNDHVTDCFRYQSLAQVEIPGKC